MVGMDGKNEHNYTHANFVTFSHCFTVDCFSWCVCWRLPKQMKSLTLLRHQRCAERSIAKLTFSIWCYVKQATNLVWSMEPDGSWNIMRWSLLIDRPTWFGISHQPPPSPFFVPVALKQAVSPPIPYIPASIFTVCWLQYPPNKVCNFLFLLKYIQSSEFKDSPTESCMSPSVFTPATTIKDIQICLKILKVIQIYSKIFKNI